MSLSSDILKCVFTSGVIKKQTLIRSVVSKSDVQQNHWENKQINKNKQTRKKQRTDRSLSLAKPRDCFGSEITF